MSELNKIILNGSEYDIGGSSGSGGTIPAENVSETEHSEDVNIIPEDIWTDGKYVNGSGRETDNTAYTLSDYIGVADTDTVKFLVTRTNYSLTVNCYDSTKTWMSNVGTGYTTANVESVVSLPTDTAFVRISMAIGYRTNKNIVYLKIPMTYTVRDWVDTAYNRMNQLAVRADIYSRLSALDALLWNYTKWNGKYIVADGNSLVASSNWIATTCSFLGATAVNLGKSGGAITKPDQPSASATIAQKQAYIVNNIDTNYPAKADLILLQESSYLDGEYSDQMDGENPTDTWCARMNYFIRCLKTKYPNVIIVLMPDPTWYKSGFGGGGNDSTTNTSIVDEIFNSRNRESYEVMKGLAEYNRLAFFDVDHSTPFNPLMKANYYAQYYWLHEQYPTISQDGVHPYYPYNTAKGYALAHFMAGLIFDPDAPNDAQEGWTSMIYTINSDGSATYPDVE